MHADDIFFNLMYLMNLPLFRSGQLQKMSIHLLNDLSRKLPSKCWLKMISLPTTRQQLKADNDECERGEGDI